MEESLVILGFGGLLKIDILESASLRVDAVILLPKRSAADTRGGILLAQTGGSHLVLVQSLIPRVYEGRIVPNFSMRHIHVVARHLGSCAGAFSMTEKHVSGKIGEMTAVQVEPLVRSRLFKCQRQGSRPA